MPDRVSYDPALFSGTAGYYRRFRSPYPLQTFAYLQDRFSLRAGTRLLDLGCGTGQLAIPLAKLGCSVVAMDPDTEMLAEASAAADQAHVEIELRRGSSFELDEVHERFDLVVMGQSFHWMDRDATLTALDRIVEPCGAVALIAPAHRDESTHDEFGRAQAVTREVVAEFLGPERRAGSGTYGHPIDHHEVVLARSSFSQLSCWRHPWVRTWTLDELLGLTLSLSWAAPPLFGARLGEFQDVLRARLRVLLANGTAEELSEVEVLSGERPS